ncbi:hypothetical protein [Nocardioides sp. GY 10127]|uniref:hypothetical protein n=1 Tax=Nocardioides sp. GY 10127 TaxID=2569762 RepID=UPI0010A80CA3|nr:hypothetical protein [Nocardioides sp. GY 10127]TIC80973.1 hypothetical protein E8D37_14205 [Nocardioides sp. GY 10127]
MSDQQTSALRVPRFAEQALERTVGRTRLRSVPAVRTPAARMPFVVLIGVLLLGGVVGLLMFNTSLQSAAFTETALESQATTLTARQEELSTELETLRDPQTIARKAQRLGMEIPAAPVFLKLSDGKVVGDVADATVGSTLNLRQKTTSVPSWGASSASSSSKKKTTTTDDSDLPTDDSAATSTGSGSSD